MSVINRHTIHAKQNRDMLSKVIFFLFLLNPSTPGYAGEIGLIWPSEFVIGYILKITHLECQNVPQAVKMVILRFAVLGLNHISGGFFWGARPLTNFQGKFGERADIPPPPPPHHQPRATFISPSFWKSGGGVSPMPPTYPPPPSNALLTRPDGPRGRTVRSKSGQYSNLSSARLKFAKFNDFQHLQHAGKEFSFD